VRCIANFRTSSANRGALSASVGPLFQPRSASLGLKRVTGFRLPRRPRGRSHTHLFAPRSPTSPNSCNPCNPRNLCNLCNLCNPFNPPDSLILEIPRRRCMVKCVSSLAESRRSRASPLAPGSSASILIMKVPYTKSGKDRDVVWQRNRYGQICYPAFVPFNPRTPAQMAGRQIFRAVSARWRTLTQEQREVWIAVAWNVWSKPRLGSGRLPGFNYFVKVNVALVNQGKPQVDLPPEAVRPSKRTVSSRPATLEGSPPSAVPLRRTGSKHEESGKLPQAAVASVRGGVVASRPSAGGRRTLLRYRSSTVVYLCYHRSSTLVGRRTLLCPQNRLRYPCRSRPPDCRGAPATQ
jgi:hypothetical protein